MSGLRCTFCGKDWVQGCWTKQEAYSCGNNDGSIVPKVTPPAPVPLPKRLQRQIDATQHKLIALLNEAREYRAKHADENSN
jgi:hypothetical protein